LLLKYADALVDLQLPNEALLDRQMAGEMSKAEYLNQVASQKRAQPVLKTVDEIRDFLAKHKLPYDNHFVKLWLEIMKAARASPTNPEDRN